MNLEHYQIEKIKKEIREIVSRYLDTTLYHVFFFGSRVSGNCNERSDIDIGIEGPTRIPSSAFINILEDVENIPTMYKIEVVDFKRVPNEFRHVALKKIEVIV